MDDEGAAHHGVVVILIDADEWVPCGVLSKIGAGAAIDGVVEGVVLQFADVPQGVCIIRGRVVVSSSGYTVASTDITRLMDVETVCSLVWKAKDVGGDLRGALVRTTVGLVDLYPAPNFRAIRGCREDFCVGVLVSTS